MDAFDISELFKHQEQTARSYLEFFRADSLSLGVYRLAAGAHDPQQPHGEDEVYYVASGRARVKVGLDDREVASGAIVFVKAGEEHRFHSITEELLLLVFFAPAEYSSAAVK
jgi:mannose-6-phosphate isomerase-like protein (cupin superfamily)